jgi:hypothetical protein
MNNLCEDLVLILFQDWYIINPLANTNLYFHGILNKNKSIIAKYHAKNGQLPNGVKHGVYEIYGENRSFKIKNKKISYSYGMIHGFKIIDDTISIKIYSKWCNDVMIKELCVHYNYKHDFITVYKNGYYRAHIKCEKVDKVTDDEFITLYFNDIYNKY